MVEETQNSGGPLTHLDQWGDVAEPARRKDTCPITQELCANWDKGPLMCLVVGKCIHYLNAFGDDNDERG